MYYTGGRYYAPDIQRIHRIFCLYCNVQEGRGGKGELWRMRGAGIEISSYDKH